MKKAMLDRKITNRLRGITADEDRRLFDIQHRVWYGRWEHFADFLLTKPTDSAILKYAHGLIDGITHWILIFQTVWKIWYYVRCPK